MATNGHHEGTPLLEKDESQRPRNNGAIDPGTPSSVGVSSHASSSATSDVVVTMNDPWPRTFERSISLREFHKLFELAVKIQLMISLLVVARTHFDVRDVNHITKSPRFDHFNKRRQQKMNSRLKELNRGFFTPDAPSAQLNSPTTYSDTFRKILPKIRSLDFARKPEPVSTTTAKNSIAINYKQEQARLYRERILRNQAQQNDIENNINEMNSPGFRKEEKSLRMKEERTVENTDKSSYSQCVFNMSNILMGVGLLGLPFVMKSAGAIGGICIILLFGAITWRTSILIGHELNGDCRPSSFFDDSPFKSPHPPGSSPHARMRSPLSSFPDIAREAFGERGSAVLASVLYFELFSCLGIFLVSIGQHLHELFPAVKTETHMTVVAIILTVPTALLRTPRLLSYLSAVGTFATVAVVFAVVLSAALNGNVTSYLAQNEGLPSDGKYHSEWDPNGIPIALGLVAYSFSGHAIVPSIYTSMKRPQDFDSMIGFTFSVVIFACLLVGISGYYMFGDFVFDQVTISIAVYDSGGDMSWLTWLMVLTAFSKFTLTMFPLALGMEEIVAPLIVNEESADIVAGFIRVSLILLALLVAIFFPSFSFLCSLVGLLCTMIVSVIFPAAAHLVMFGGSLSTTDKVLDYIFIVFGTISAVLGTIATLS